MRVTDDTLTEITPACTVELSTHAVHLLRISMSMHDPSDPETTPQERADARTELCGYLSFQLWG